MFASTGEDGRLVLFEKDNTAVRPSTAAATAVAGQPTSAAEGRSDARHHSAVRTCR